MSQAQANHRKIQDAAQSRGIACHVVIPPIVYGQSRAFGNVISIQNVALVRLIQHCQQAAYIPSVDDLEQTYAICHIADLAALYITLLKKSHHKASNGFYFAESGVVAWTRLASEFAKGLALPTDPVAFDATKFDDLVPVLGVPDASFVRPWVGGRYAMPHPQVLLHSLILQCRTNISGRNGRKIGWQPQHSADHVLAVASEEARFIARQCVYNHMRPYFCSFLARLSLTK